MVWDSYRLFRVSKFKDCGDLVRKRSAHHRHKSDELHLSMKQYAIICQNTKIGLHCPFVVTNIQCDYGKMFPGSHVEVTSIDCKRPEYFAEVSGFNSLEEGFYRIVKNVRAVLAKGEVSVTTSSPSFLPYLDLYVFKSGNLNVSQGR